LKILGRGASGEKFSVDLDTMIFFLLSNFTTIQNQITNMKGEGEHDVYHRFVEGISNVREITPELKLHLLKVYALLGYGCMVAMGAGIHGHSVTKTIGPMALWVLGLVAMIMVQLATNLIVRFSCYTVFCGHFGLLLIELVEHINMIDPMIVPQSLVMTALCFLVFSSVTLFVKRRTMLFLGGILLSILVFIFFTTLLNFYFESELLINVNIYGGLLMFLGYVSFDTFMIIEKWYSGEGDPFNHAVELFIDLVGIFIRIAIILAKNKKKKKGKT
jgi:FtsH-binding integral membrane protein